MQNMVTSKNQEMASRKEVSSIVVAMLGFTTEPTEDIMI